MFKETMVLLVDTLKATSERMDVSHSRSENVQQERRLDYHDNKTTPLNECNTFVLTLQLQVYSIQQKSNIMSHIRKVRQCVPFLLFCRQRHILAASDCLIMKGFPRDKKKKKGGGEDCQCNKKYMTK